MVGQLDVSPITDCSRAINPPPKYWVVRDSFCCSTNFHLLSQLNIYTDGSRTPDSTDTGYSIFEGTNEYDYGSFVLPEYSTVFQAELVAILLAARHVLREAQAYGPDTLKSLATLSLPSLPLRPDALPVEPFGTPYQL